MTLSYNSPLFFAAFLPLVAIIYQIMPKKYRWAVLLVADYVFFFMWSKFLLAYNVATTFITYLFGRKLGSMLPNKLMNLDEMPMTKNGKIDRNQLKELGGIK